MQYIQPPKEENSPFLQLLLLGVYVVVGLLVFMVIGFVIAFLVYGTALIKNLDWLNGNSPEYVGALKILLTTQQLGMFLVPALLLAITEGKKPQRFYEMKKPSINLLLIVFLIMLFATPLMGFINQLNQQMVLPDFLKSLQNWMRKLEDEGIKTTMTLLKMSSIGALLINLTVVAVVPAICEEFLFRAALQRIFMRWLRSPHVAIWISAIVFSTIHFQFFGFFPRLLLGAMFGYIYFWTGSIWYTIFAHFLNNAYAVCVAYYFQKNNMPMNTDDGTSVTWYVALISAIFTLALFWILKEKALKKEEIQQEI